MTSDRLSQYSVKPPPDFNSRPMQLRLFLMAALLVGVLYAATEARKPQRWDWLWKLGERQEVEDIDTRLPTAEHSHETADGEVIVRQAAPATLENTANETNKNLSMFDRAWRQGWRDTDERCSPEERQQLYRILDHARREAGEPFPEEHVQPAEATVVNLEVYWQEYVTAARLTLDRIVAEERPEWEKILTQLASHWSDQVKPALLQAITNASSLTNDQKTLLTDLQTLVDEIGLGKVRDNALYRAGEREIMFRLFGKLRGRPAPELRKESTGVVSYAQLFKQSGNYRGQLVTVRGRVKAAYEVKAPANVHGIEKYWNFWLFPEGGPPSPLLIYSLEIPPGFPTMAAEDVNRKEMPSQEDVEFTGYFFKRWAYQGKGGMYTTPTILASTPEWLTPEETPRLEPPSWSTIMATLGGLIAFATAFALWVYYQYPPGRPRSLASDKVEIPVA